MEGGSIVGGGNIPPLILNTGTQNAVQPIIVKKEGVTNAPTSTSTQPLYICLAPGFNTGNSNMRLVQRPDGKKFLLTNVVKTTKPTDVCNPVMLASPPAQPQIRPVMATNAPQTLIVQQPSKAILPAQKQPVVGSQPLMIRVPGMNQTLLVRPNTEVNSGSSVNSVPAPSAPAAQVVTVKQEPIETPASPSANNTILFNGQVPKTLLAPKVSLAPNMTNPVVLLSNEGKKYKVVGTPVPVRLHPKLPKLAPKGQAPIPPLKKVDQPPTVQPGSSQKITHSSKPPAYLNIKIKDEPKDEPDNEPIGETVFVDGGVKIKDEPIDPQIELEEALEMASQESLLDIRIKEEPTEQDELIEKDEQLRNVLEVAPEVSAEESPNKPRRFYIRTAEGKLVSISPEEAEALGLDHKDKAEENQKKLIKALTGVQDFPLKKLIADQKRDKSQCIVLIPDNVNVKDFVSRNVPPAAEKEAALMKTLKCTKSALEAKFSTSSVFPPSKAFPPTKTSTTIIGEYMENGVHFLKIHIETRNGERDVCNIPKTPLNTYQCPFCKKDFKTKDHIISHIRVHTGERPYPCDICGKRYRQRIDIIRHMRIHTGEKPFTCGLCNASFNQKSNLRSHMRIHTGERPVQCRICGKGFSRNTHLKQHMKLHTGEKPYSCKVCCRPFRFKSGLQAHERIHSGLKPYACSVCGRSFTQIVGLIRHERTHAGEKPYRCQSCGKSFNNLEILQFHLKKHTGDRPYSCDLCKKTFTDKSALRCHRKKYHSNMLICVICLREDFKSRIELREHLRAHERENWEENENGDLVPRVQEGSPPFVSVDDTMDDLEENDDSEQEESMEEEKEGAEEIQVEVELDVDDPIENDEAFEDSDCEDQNLQVDPLVDPLT